VRASHYIGLFVLWGGAVLPAYGTGHVGAILNSKHDFRAASQATIRSVSGRDPCVFCHTPHNSNPGTYLWNQKLSTTQFPPYSSTTLQSSVTPIQPQDVSKLCLSCTTERLPSATRLTTGSFDLCKGPLTPFRRVPLPPWERTGDSRTTIRLRLSPPTPVRSRSLLAPARSAWMAAERCSVPVAMILTRRTWTRRWENSW